MKTILCISVLVAAVAAGTARADGLPVLGVDVGPMGIPAPGAQERYAAVPVGRDTLVARLARGGRADRFRVVRGRLGIPVVAYDGSAAGFSGDGRSLVLLVPRVGFPRATTGLAILDTRTLRIRKRVTLRGDFSFDARSPDGRWVYLIRYTAPDDPLRYEVRVLDIATGRLLPGAIVDPREPDEAMTGRPLTRSTSTDGRWAYTLYEGALYPFVHALDTVGRSARCIDLDFLHGRRDLWAMRFSPSVNGTLAIRSGKRTVAIVDTRAFVGRRPAADSAARQR